MRQPKIFHELFSEHPRNGINTSMTDVVEGYKPTGLQPNWVPGVGIPDGSYELVYRGPARVNPNVDWRARDRNHSGELNATQAVRIQLPIGKNEVGATVVDGEIVEYGPDVLIGKDYVFQVISSQADAAPWLPEYAFTVRNALQASQKWLFNLLCDTGTRIVGD